MEPSSDFIRFENVSRTFDVAGATFAALDGISFSLARGEYCAVVGKSGSGKSTLLNMLTGIDHPTAGAVTLNGTRVHTLGESALATWRGRSVGIVFQFFQLIPTLTIRENLLLAMDFVNVVPGAERVARANAVLERTGILAQADKLPAALSGGEQQRAAIARALANDPPVIVADEPTGNLDSRTTEVIQALFASLVQSGKTVVVVTHEKVLGPDYHRVITLKDGRIVDDTRAAGVAGRERP